MNRPNFDKQMQDALQTVPQGTPLLLHSCCGPCSTRCIEELKQTFSVTVFYYNPNIYPRGEYEKRKSEQLRFLRETGWAGFLDCDYAAEDFQAAVQGLEGEPEGGLRCRACFALRLGVLARTAKERGFPWGVLHAVGQPAQKRGVAERDRAGAGGKIRRALASQRF